MFQLGEVVGLIESENAITVRDIFTKSVMQRVPLDNIRQIQYMPVIGDMVLIMNYEDKIMKVVKVWNIQKNNLIREGEYSLQEGDLQLMGIMGQYIYLDNEGTIKFVDSTMVNLLELTVEGFKAKLKQFDLTTYDGVHLTVDKDIVLYRGKEEEDEDKSFSAKLTDDGIVIKNKTVEITIDNNNNVTVSGSVVTVKADTVNLGGDTLTSGIVTGGATGTMPFCFVTGAPILGSTKCLAQR